MSVRARASKAAATAAAGGDVYDRMGFLIDPDDIPAYTHTLAELEHREKLFASKWTSFVTKNFDSAGQIFPSRLYFLFLISSYIYGHSLFWLFLYRRKTYCNAKVSAVGVIIA